MELNPMIDDMETPLSTEFEKYKNSFSFALSEAKFDKTVFFSVNLRHSDYLTFTCYDINFLDYLKEYKHIKYFLLYYDPSFPHKIVVRIPDEIKNHRDTSLAKKAKIGLVDYLKIEYEFEIQTKQSINLPQFVKL